MMLVTQTQLAVLLARAAHDTPFDVVSTQAHRIYYNVRRMRTLDAMWCNRTVREGEAKEYDVCWSALRKAAVLLHATICPDTYTLSFPNGRKVMV